MALSSLVNSLTKPYVRRLGLDRRRKQAWLRFWLIAGVVLLIGSAFVDFGKFITPEIATAHPYALELTAAILGTALTVALTTILLRHQSNAEIDRERNVKIYETKVEIYKNLLKRIEGILEDEKLSQNEFFRLQLTFQEVVFIAGPRVLNELPAFAYVMASVEQDTQIGADSKKHILHAFGRLASEVRADLHDPHPHGEDIGFDVEEVLTKIEANFAPRFSVPAPTETSPTLEGKEDQQAYDAFLAKHNAEYKHRCEVFLALCTDDDRDLYREFFGKIVDKTITPRFDSVGMVFRSKSDRIILHIHPDSAMPNKIFSDNLNFGQVGAARKILRQEDWRRAVVSHWTFTTNGIKAGELLDLIEALQLTKLDSRNRAPSLERAAH